MERDFDKRIDRKNTNSVKYDFAKEYKKPEDVLFMWVADMDFQAPRAVTEALKKISEFGIFGYSSPKESYIEAIQNWYESHFFWKPHKEWLVKTPGVVTGITMVIRALTKEGDAVMIQQPVYYPFRQTIEANRRKVIDNSLILRDGRYEMDYEDMERKIKKYQVKLFILCSPHNPVGRVWTKKELQKAADILIQNRVIVISDEIHADFTYKEHAHTIFSSLSKESEQMCITCTAPSKTFNLAGLQTSNLFIPNEEYREKLEKEIARAGLDEINIYGLAACEAAYRGGEQWLFELKDYLQGNLSYIREFIKKDLPKVKLIEPEGTYLIWLDFRGARMNREELEYFIVEKARLWLDAGTMFGEEGEGFERMNIACPRSVIEEAMKRLKKAFEERDEGLSV